MSLLNLLGVEYVVDPHIVPRSPMHHVARSGWSVNVTLHHRPIHGLRPGWPANVTSGDNYHGVPRLGLAKLVALNAELTEVRHVLADVIAHAEARQNIPAQQQRQDTLDLRDLQDKGCSIDLQPNHQGTLRTKNVRPTKLEVLLLCHEEVRDVVFLRLPHHPPDPRSPRNRPATRAIGDAVELGLRRAVSHVGDVAELHLVCVPLVTLRVLLVEGALRVLVPVPLLLARGAVGPRLGRLDALLLIRLRVDAPRVHDGAVLGLRVLVGHICLLCLFIDALHVHVQLRLLVLGLSLPQLLGHIGLLTLLVLVVLIVVPSPMGFPKSTVHPVLDDGRVLKLVEVVVVARG